MTQFLWPKWMTSSFAIDLSSPVMCFVIMQFSQRFLFYVYCSKKGGWLIDQDCVTRLSFIMVWCALSVICDTCVCATGCAGNLYCVPVCSYVDMCKLNPKNSGWFLLSFSWHSCLNIGKENRYIVTKSPDWNLYSSYFLYLSLFLITPPPLYVCFFFAVCKTVTGVCWNNVYSMRSSLIVLFLFKNYYATCVCVYLINLSRVILSQPECVLCSWQRLLGWPSGA